MNSKNAPSLFPADPSTAWSPVTRFDRRRVARWMNKHRGPIAAAMTAMLVGCSDKPAPETVPDLCPGTDYRPGQVVSQLDPKLRQRVFRAIGADCMPEETLATAEQMQAAQELTRKWREMEMQKSAPRPGAAVAGGAGLTALASNAMKGGQGDWTVFAVQLLASGLAGAAFGAFFSERARPIRRWLWLAFLVALLVVMVWQQVTPLAHAALFLIAAVAAWKALRVMNARARSTVLGSAEWATLEHTKAHGLVGTEGLLLGTYGAQKEGAAPLSYKGERHLLTVAPTRSGKGVCAIIPNLLTYTGSAVVVDPKGENAIITAARRGAGLPDGAPGLGQAVHVVDPWGITGLTPACFNPLDWLRADDPDVNENAMMLADSIVVARTGGNNAFWDDESKGLLMGLLLHVALDPGEAPHRHLGRVRDIIVSPAEAFTAVLQSMHKSESPVVASTAARTAGKAPELRANVLTSLQAHTHFLDSPRIRESLSRSDFSFADLKEKPTSIYLVLPSDRLDTFGRWLRLLIQQAITINARNIDRKPEKPILFLLDEMPALGRLTMVEQAYGLMAGFGMQLWGIVQDLGQLERVYGPGWETFVGNSGVLQTFGIRDQKSAEYFSKLCGVTTVEKTSFSRSFSRSFGANGGGSESSSVNEDAVQRPLVFPDELMVLRRQQQVLLVENCNPILGQRVNWFEDLRLKALGFNTHKPKG